MRKLRIGIVAVVVALASSVLPSGAGQHFGIIGGDSGTFGGVNANGPGAAPSDAAGVFTWGVKADLRDGSSQPSVRIVTFAGCVALQTDRGEDHGCVESMDLPVLADPLLEQAVVETSIPSSVYQGTMIQVSLVFRASGLPLPEATFGLGRSPLIDATVQASLARGATVKGIVASPAVGEVPIDTLGTLARGATVVACSYDGLACP